MNSKDSIDSKKIQDLKRIFLNYTHFSEKYRITTLQNYSGICNREYYEVLILALNDSSRYIRNFIIDILEKKKDFPLEKYLTTYSRLRRNSIARLMGRLYPEFKRKKPYQIIRELSVQRRSECILKYIDQIVSEVDSNKIFHAAISLELIGDFRAISILRQTTSITSILESQLNRHMNKHDDYSTFIVILRYCQNSNDENLKKQIFKHYIQDLLRIANDYEFSEVFIQIFNDLGLLGNLIYNVHQLSLNQKIIKTLNYSVGSLAYKTMLVIFSAEYPSSFQELEHIRSEISDPEKKEKIDQISKSLLKNFKVNLNSGYPLFL
ncbi:hypothetical protein DSAG12_03447 [Promethearchaeum syntrophicum]|uniref:Uncharacterized protein n=1 Tax=Promethearchaeum syntrophicum TaxID=2594042 RepID=A0A5B9DFQ1_9ARCH|nr:hypothetical protein [Candidatus Prometheoarchaeum syntrophicum]QEE17610.1 hypothetical protein DSAG12_03447 [Candidatus Prometheoarchaeum syntrophicum]